MKKVLYPLGLSFLLPVMAPMSFAELENNFDELEGGMTYNISIDLTSTGPVETTIANIVEDKNASGEVEGYFVYPNSDYRLFYVSAQSVEFTKVDEALKNGYLVRLNFEEDNSKSNRQQNVFVITSVEVLVRENTLTTGLLPAVRNSSPIVAQSRRELNAWFYSDDFYKYDSDEYDVNDNCFNRALYWSRSLQWLLDPTGQNQKRTDKVFIFFSRAYQKEFDHKWWYHVAPVVYVADENANDGKRPFVFDSTFIPKPVPLTGRGGWLDAFAGQVGGNCLEIQTLNQYNEFNMFLQEWDTDEKRWSGQISTIANDPQYNFDSETAVVDALLTQYRLDSVFKNKKAREAWIKNPQTCMYIVRPGFNYVPGDLNQGRNLNNWRCTDFTRGLFGYSAPGSKPEARERFRDPSITWNREEFKWVLPEGCTETRNFTPVDVQ